MTPGTENPSELPAEGRVPPEPVVPPSRYSFGQRAFGQPDHGEQPYDQHALNQQAYAQPVPYQPAYQQQPYGQPAYQQQPYGSQGYNQPTIPRAFPQAAPDQQQEQNPYQVTPAQYYRDQGYGDPAPAEPFHLPQSSLRKPRKPTSTLGIASAFVVIGMLVVCLFAAQPLGAAYSMIYLTLGTVRIDSSQLTEAMVTPALLPSVAIGVASFVGFVGMILGIVAAVSNRGRGWGVCALILGILAPFIWVTVLVATVMPAIAAIS